MLEMLCECWLDQRIKQNKIKRIKNSVTAVISEIAHTRKRLEEITCKRYFISLGVEPIPGGSVLQVALSKTRINVLLYFIKGYNTKRKPQSQGTLPKACTHELI